MDTGSLVASGVLEVFLGSPSGDASDGLINEQTGTSGGRDGSSYESQHPIERSSSGNAESRKN